MYGYLLVILQFLFIGLLTVTGNSSELNGVSVTMIISGLSLGLWSIWVMKKSKLRTIPQPGTGAKLITEGPYRYIRHPMYTSVLISAFGLLLTDVNWFRTGLYLFLLIILLSKIAYEEVLLDNFFPEYKQYKQSTKKLIPYIY
jgi:protein-S-isoprenylcysteine O-methyltransferase Ste14